MLPAKPQESALEYASVSQTARISVDSAQLLFKILQYQGHPLASKLKTVIQDLQQIESALQDEETIVFDWSPLLAAIATV